jgi:hypothetical protein
MSLKVDRRYAGMCSCVDKKKENIMVARTYRFMVGFLGCLLSASMVGCELEELAQPNLPSVPVAFRQHCGAVAIDITAFGD